MNRKLVIACAAFGLAGLVFVPTASALPIVTPTVTVLSDGRYEYSYLLDNTDGAEAIFDFGIYYFGEVDGATVEDPTGWLHVEPGYDPATGEGYINWYSPLLEDGSAPYDLLPGDTLSGFSFISALGPGPIAFTVNGFLDDRGTTVGPNPVPEPGTLLLLGMGATGLFVRRRRPGPQA